MAQCSHQSFKMFSAPALNSRTALQLSILSLANFSRLRCVSKTLSSSRPRSRTRIIRVCVNRRSRVRVRHLELWSSCEARLWSICPWRDSSCYVFLVPSMARCRFGGSRPGKVAVSGCFLFHPFGKEKEKEDSAKKNN